MVFPGLLTSGGRASSNRSKSNLETDLLSEYIYDELQLPCIPPERPDLRQLNNSLEALAVVFPDVQAEVFRELLSHFEGESRLALVADALLKNRVEWVKGRWKVVDQHVESVDGLPKAEAFRSQDYKKAATALAWYEFKGLSRSTISAVLAESNYSYLDARQTLVTLSSKSWRFAFSSLFLRRKPIATGEAQNHPLVVWRSSGQGSIIPTIRATGSPELDRELYNSLIAPIKEHERQNQEVKDRNLAIMLNNEEAEQAKATHECSCCFVDAPFEEFTQCSVEGHMICFRCVQHSIKEALFGQAWQSSINAETGTLRCVSVDGDGCQGCVPYEQVWRAVVEDSKGAAIMHKLDQRLAEHSLIAANLPLIRCPFCNYAEVDEIYTSLEDDNLFIRVDKLWKVLLLIILTIMAAILFPTMAISWLVCLIANSDRTLGQYLSTEWRQAMNRRRRRRRGLRFVCHNEDCKRSSCMSCQKPWHDIHVCNESSLVALRTQVEQAMSMAIKRVCPRCNTSFVKNAGCNKLACPCGYKMCYVCRADLREEGYRHFCDHFRPDGDPRPCKECDKCNLWESEDTDLVLKQARDEAERRWRDMEKRDLSDSERSFLKTGFASKSRHLSTKKLLFTGKLPTVPEFFDLIFESVFL